MELAKTVVPLEVTGLPEPDRAQEEAWNEQREACALRFKATYERIIAVLRDEKALGVKAANHHISVITSEYLTANFKGRSREFKDCAEREVVNYASWLHRGKPDTRLLTYQPRMMAPEVKNAAVRQPF